MSFGHEASEFLKSLSNKDQEIFYALYDVLDKYRIVESVNQKITNGYSQQPSGYDNVPMLVFCKVANGGSCSAHTWMARIPLVLPLTVILPEAIRPKEIDDKLIVHGNAGCYRPSDAEAFIANPDLYIDINSANGRMK